MGFLDTLGSNSKSSPPGFVGNLGQQPEAAPLNFAQELAQPFARAGLNIANAGIGIFNPSLAKKIDQQGANIPLLGHTTEIGMTGRGLGADVADTLGEGAQLASYAIPAGEATGIAKAGFAGAVKKGALAGAASGALGGAGTNLQDPNASAGSVLGSTVSGGLGGAAAGAVLGPALLALAKTPVGVLGVKAYLDGGDKWTAFTSKYPTAASQIENVSNPSKAISKVFNKTPTLQTTMDAVSPELKGTKLTQAYKDVVSGGDKTVREIKPGGLFKQQAVTANARETDVGKRLFDAGIRLENKPVKDITTLRDALKTTETKLEDVLKGSKAEFGADKIPLIKTLDKIGTNMPEEFKAIKDNGAVFKGVLGFGKRIVMKASDTIEGLRNARGAFDAQAKIEFPSAFRDGSIDLKTPAGRAIKAVRDAINDHLYQTAPEGSEIKNLIGTEADIYRARDAIAPRAAAGEGKNALQKLYKATSDHPLVSGVTAGLGAVGIAKGIGL